MRGGKAHKFLLVIMAGRGRAVWGFGAPPAKNERTNGFNPAPSGQKVIEGAVNPDNPGLSARLHLPAK